MSEAAYGTRPVRGHPAGPARAGWLAMTGWLALTALAALVGVFSLRYALPHIPLLADLPNAVRHRGALAVHAVSAALALLLGPLQFLAGLRQRHPGVHRWVGRSYAAALLVAGLSALAIAPSALGGSVSAAGFACLGVGWLVTTTLGVRAIRRRQVAAHRRWMIRSYALTAAAITLRLYLLATLVLHLPFVPAYTAIAWLCWVPNLLAAEAWLHWERSRADPRRAAAPGPALA